MAKMGRPRIEIDRGQFEKLCALQCTEEEIAAWFHCSVDTIERWCKREYADEVEGKATFAEIYKTLSVDGKISLRRYQFKMAEHNVSMAIWLGKQWLGQREQQELIIDRSADETIKEMDEYFTKQRRSSPPTLE